MREKSIDWEKIDRDLKDSHLFLHSIFDNIPNMIFVKDASTLRFVTINKAGENLVGYSRAELIGKNDYDFFTKEEADFFTQKDRMVLTQGKLFDIPEETVHTRFNGIRILHTKKIPISGPHGVPKYLLGISEDITDRKKLETEVLEISEREQQRIGQDLHDGLGQHLTGIALLVQGLAKKLKAKKVREAKQAYDIGELVNQAIAHTRDLARLLYPHELQSHGLMSALQELASNTQKMLRIHCSFRCAEPLFFHDKTVAAHLYRIAQESLDNAVKHGKAKHVQIELAQHNKKISLIIRDDGTGFNIRNAPHTGMGMAIMRHRATMIKANLKLKKNTPTGTIVICALP